jgi:hypothetical protein
MEHHQWAALSFIVPGWFAHCLPQQAICVSENMATGLLYISGCCGQSQSLVVSSSIPVRFTHAVNQLSISRFPHQVGGQVSHPRHSGGEVGTRKPQRFSTGLARPLLAYGLARRPAFPILQATFPRGRNRCRHSTASLWRCSGQCYDPVSIRAPCGRMEPALGGCHPSDRRPLNP